MNVKKYLFLALAFFIISACKGITNSSEVEDSLEPVSEVSFINGSENTVLTVNRSQESFFELNFENVGSTDVVENGPGSGWCIDWQKPIDSNGGVYSDIRLYSTFLVEKWNPLNFLLNIEEQIREADSEITFLEIQLAIWSLQGFPEFDIDNVELDELPPRMLENGQPAFNIEKVKEILDIVNEGHSGFAFVEGTKFAVIAETPADVQTVITVVQ